MAQIQKNTPAGKGSPQHPAPEKHNETQTLLERIEKMIKSWAEEMNAYKNNLLFLAEKAPLTGEKGEQSVAEANQAKEGEGKSTEKEAVDIEKLLASVEGDTKKLTLEEIEKLKATAAGGASGSSVESSPPIIFGGHLGSVDSLPRDLGLGPYPQPTSELITPPPEPLPVTTPAPDNVVIITDLTPQLQGGDTTVLEQNLLASRGPGESEGSAAVKGPTTVGGSFFISAPDGVGTLQVGGIALITNGVFTSQSITTPLGNILNFISYDPGTGIIQYQYTLLDNELHDPIQGSNSLFESFPVFLSDVDGDTASDILSINVVDDTPSIQTSEQSSAQLTVDETNLAQNAMGSFASLFDSVPGADGAQITYALGVSANGADSGLVDVATNTGIQLFLEGGSVVGRVGGAAGDIAFTISIDGNTGDVTLDQVRALQHADPSDPDDAAMLLSPDLITLQATITDADGDVSNATRDIANSFIFKDDGPSINVGQADASLDQLTVDETNLAANASANFADNFTSTSSYGADDAGSQSSGYALSISSDGADSGLMDVASGQSVLLFINGGVVEGRTSGSNELVFTVSVDGTGMVTLDQIRALTHPDTGNPDDAVTLSSADLIQLTRTDTITDRDGDTASSSSALNIGQALSFHDDGPSIDVSIVAQADQLTVDETNLANNASANFADNFASTSSYGVDDAGSQSSAYALSILASGADSGLIDVASGQSVLLFMNAGVVEGRTSGGNELVFMVSVDGSGTVTLDQIRALTHPNASDPDDSVTLGSADFIQITRTDTIVDRDGDTASSSATLDIGQALNFHDDGPSIDVSVSAPADQLTVDETNLANNASANFADNFVSTSSYGVDDAGSQSSAYALSILASGADSGLIDVASGQSVLLFMNAGVVEGRTSGGNELVFMVSVDGSGTVTLDQIRALTHPNASDPDDSVTLGSANLIQITRTDTIVDRDGDTASSSATLNIGQALNFHDDGPSISVEQADASLDQLTVDETNLAANASANFADNFTSTSNYGADDAGSQSSGYALSISSDGADGGLMDVASGQSVLLFMNGGVVEGRTSGSNELVFTVSVDGTGMVTLDQIRALTHPDTGNPDDAVTLSSADLIQLTRTDTITDRDGDTASSSSTLGIAQALSFHDDGPSIDVSIVAQADQLTVDETNLANNASANFADNFASTSSYGADDAGSQSSAYALSILASGADSGLIDVTSGQNVLLFMNAGVVEGRTSGGNELVFTVSVDGSGMVTLDQIRALTHPNASDPDDSVTLNSANLIQITRTDTIVDRDGDTASSSATLDIGQALNFHDDGPNINVSASAPADPLSVDETNLAVNATANFADNFIVSSSSYGADNAGSQSSAYALSISASGANSGLVDVASGQSVLLFMNGGTVEGRTSGGNLLVFTLTVSGAGSVTLDQIRALTHPNASDPDDVVTLSSSNLIQLTRTDTIVDKDGDTASGSASINIGQALAFHDDGPSLSNVNDPDADHIIEISAYNPAANVTQTVQMVDWNFGADNGVNPTLASSTGNLVLTGVSSSQALIKFYDASGVDLLATLTLNQNGTESLELAHRQGTIEQDSLLTGEAKAGGPGIYFVDSSISPDLTVKVTATNGGASDSVNPSNQGWAVGNNIISVNETIKFEALDKNTLLSDPINNFSFIANGFTGGQSAYDISVKVFYNDLTTETFTFSVTEGQSVSVADIPGFNTGSLIAAVEVSNVDTSPGGNVGFRLNGINIFSRSENPPPDMDYTFSVNFTDNDGDKVTQAFTLHLDGDPPPSLPGYTIDGPIVGAMVFQDLNENSIIDSGENYAITDHLGAYNLMVMDTNLDGMINHLDGRLESIGGTDSETGLTYDIPLFAPLGSTVISPFTSLLEVQLEGNDQHDISGIMDHLSTALGLASQTDLTSLNPIVAAEQGDVSALSQAAGVMTLSLQLAAACEGMLGGSPSEYIQKIYQSIGDQVMDLPTGQHADFANTDLLHSIVSDLSHQLGIESGRFDPIMDALSQSQHALQDSLAHLPEGADPVDAISSVQHVTQGVYADAISSYYANHGDSSGSALSLQDIGIQSSIGLASVEEDANATSVSVPEAAPAPTAAPSEAVSVPPPSPTVEQIIPPQEEI